MEVALYTHEDMFDHRPGARRPERLGAGRVVSSLAGGYDLEALGRSALAHVRALAVG